MNDVIQNILTRRSVRSFSERKPTKKDIELLIQAGLAAPSGMNRQTWTFTGILNPSIIKELADAIAKELGRDNYNFYNATALIIPSNITDSPWGQDDNACALENIFLAAHSLEIDSVWINQLCGITDVPEIRAILNKLGIPTNHSVYGIAALGYSTNPPVGQVIKTGQYKIIE